MKRSPILAGLVLGLALWSPPARSFCGFYVASGDAKLFNRASRVVLVRDQDSTVLTMANDFRGEPKQFAIVIPVPTVLAKDLIHVADPGLLDHIDAYSAPRLVEYFDENPCAPVLAGRMLSLMASAPERSEREAAGLGVRIEARYTVGEYDILILSADQSTGLETWLRQSGYNIPAGASRVLGSYIKQGLKFFVAKVNLKEQQKLGFSYLRPIQIAYESPRFMLPIRLGMVNADGPQELFIYALTRKGRVEATNYRTVKLPSDAEVPLFVKDEFADFYRALFDEQVRKESMQSVFTEYAWDMSWCDPCASPPLSSDELRGLGVSWLEDPGRGTAPGSRFLKISPGRRSMPIRIAPGGAGGVFITRLHVRYDGPHFPEDLVFQETADRASFQGRYILRHEWKGADQCRAADAYRSGLAERRAAQARTLATLTGWDLEEIRRRMAVK
ncbi:MAG: DUF2330 domain-containing protein [Candidatus Eisenbacteria bacterium]|uniref:DUF2330 domain-containing protein n=1 Tax=Eiseniibacteriota bacterium TaxID=2212470 RepID=A0A538SKE7_UNCEI|nr:MAG: DUF2330 domain-containing protein [Candidatus Eisenbacteria bacterium]